MKKIFFSYVLLVASALISFAGNHTVTLGDERFDQYLPLLHGKRVALFSNHSGIVGDRVFDADGKEIDRVQLCNEKIANQHFDQMYQHFGPHILDVLLTKGVDVQAIFSPEHGFRGTADAGEHVSSGRDTKTGVEILSLYEGGSRIPSKAKMDKFDVLVVDIQDVGLRYYTYYVAMYHLMQACQMYDKKVVILDRPNPNGFYVDGPLIDLEHYKSGIGWLPIAMVHGMTLGELALMINGEGWLADAKTCDLTVVPCLGYKHSMKYTLIVPPSPNLKNMKAVYLYSSTCFFEGTVATDGRGTDSPFEIYGHPQMTDCSFSFTPESIPGAKKPRYKGEVCNGRDLRSIPVKRIWKEKVNVSYVKDAYDNLNRSGLEMGDSFFLKNKHFELLVGVGWVRSMIKEGYSASEIEKAWKDDVDRFIAQRKPYLIYPD